MRHRNVKNFKIIASPFESSKWNLGSLITPPKDSWIVLYNLIFQLNQMIILFVTAIFLLMQKILRQVHGLLTSLACRQDKGILGCNRKGLSWNHSPATTDMAFRDPVCQVTGCQFCPAFLVAVGTSPPWFKGRGVLETFQTLFWSTACITLFLFDNSSV